MAIVVAVVPGSVTIFKASSSAEGGGNTSKKTPFDEIYAWKMRLKFLFCRK